MAIMVSNFAARTRRQKNRVGQLVERKSFKLGDFAQFDPNVSLRPDDLIGIEAALKAQWRNGSFHNAMKLIRLAIRLNPMEPEYYLMRGLIQQSAGIYGAAIWDFEYTLRIARREETRTKAREALHALENWQMTLLQHLIKEDCMFRYEVSLSPLEAAEKRGFRFSKEGSMLLLAVAKGESFAQVDVVGSC